MVVPDDGQSSGGSPKITRSARRWTFFKKDARRWTFCKKGARRWTFCKKKTDARRLQVGGMVVPEDVAVKWWLTKKREKHAKEKAIMVRALTPNTVELIPTLGPSPPEAGPSTSHSTASELLSEAGATSNVLGTFV